MEHPPYLQHLPRYVPLPHNHNNNHNHHHRPPNLSGDGKFHRHHHLPPPPPPPHILHPQSYRPLPPPPPPPLPPPPYNPEQSQFTFLNHHHQSHRHPIEDNPRRPPPRVSDRIQLDDDGSRLRTPEFDNLFRDSRPNSWADPPRVPPPERPRLPGFDHEPPHHRRPFRDQIHLSSYRSDDKYRHEVEGSSIIRNGFIGGFENNHAEEHLRGRIDSRDEDVDYHHGSDDHHYTFSSSGASRNFEFGESRIVSSPNLSRESGLKLGNYGSSFGSKPDCERLWNNRDENQRWVHDRPPSRELSDSRIDIEDNEFNKRDVNRGASMRRVTHTYDSSKFSSRGNREVKQEPVRTPRKKIQKKSALLRIQLGKPSNSRIRNLEKHFSSAYFDDSDTSSFRGKEPLRYSDHRTEEDREVSPVQLDVSFKSNSLVAKPIVAPSSNAVVSDRNLTPRHRKIRRVIVQDSNISNSPLTKFDEGPLEMDSSAHVSDGVPNSFMDSKQLERKVKDFINGVVCDLGSQPCSNGFTDSPHNGTMKRVVSDGSLNASPNEITEFLGNGNLSESTQTMVSDKDGAVTDSDRACAHNVKRKRTNTTHGVGLSSPLRNKIDEGITNANKLVHELHTTSSSDKGLIELQNGSTFSEIPDLNTISNSHQGLSELQNGSTFNEIGNDVNEQSFQNERSEVLENHLVKGSLEAVDLAEGNVDTGSSSAEETKVHEGPANINSFVHGPDNAFVDQVTELPENCSVEEFPKSISSVGGFITVDSSIGEETEIHNEIVSTDYTPVVKRKRKVKNTRSGLSSPRISDTSPKSRSTSDIPVNRVNSIHPVKNLIFADEEVNACSQPSKDNLCIIVDPNGTHPMSRKKRKVCVPTNLEGALNNEKSIIQSENYVAESSKKTMFAADLSYCSKPITVLLEHNVAGGSFEAVGFTDNGSELEEETRSSSGLEGEPKENASLVMATTNYQRDITDVEKIETSQSGIHIETQAPGLDLRLSTADIESNSYQLEKDDLHSVLDTRTLCAEGNNIFATTDSSDEPLESVPDTLSNMGSPETFSIGSGSYGLNDKSSIGQTSDEKVSGHGRKDEKHISNGGSVSFPLNTCSQGSKSNATSDHEVGRAHSINAKTVSYQSQNTKRITQSLNSTSEESKMAKNQTNLPLPSKKSAPLSHTVKSRTWHRTGNPSPSLPLPLKNSYSGHVPPQKQSLGNIGKVQSTSYIRKGNSLLRKPSPVASQPHGSHFPSSSVYRLNPLGIDGLKKSTGSQKEERPKTPPLLHSTKLSNCTTVSSGNFITSPFPSPPSNGGSDSTADPSKLTENMDVLKDPSEDAPKSSGTRESHTVLIDNLEVQCVQDEGNMATAKVRGIIYVKRKSNQLVAASSSSDMSVQDVEKTQALSSDAYYKRKKNQLIRKSLESHIKQIAAVPDDFLKSEGQRFLRDFPSRSSSKRRSGKGLAKTYKSSKFSWVRTLSLKKDNSMQHQIVWPQLFPWKRATYWRSFMHNSAFISNISSLSNISPKLLISRKRDTIYTRSARGFSLRRSKVLSVGGSSLKWSKSIERNSRKANEEATLAVAAAEKKKKEQNTADCIIAGMRSRNHSSRERIFRIGSVRYKMDSTRRTLQRISEEESPCSAALEPERDAKKPYVPRRLVIGDDEYVRIGNGNQLVRDPKRRTRLLASEKVRWSLHTARLRLARKRKYCQFFTRFGKCNKDGGKCPYIHDPSKIAVCTKFLSGACSNPNCKLTHKIIPERMPDCSYFLQGICSNESCPYRHVNVNRNASICEGFLRGYCADGNECRKKHSYVCPVFEATGICPQGSKCKLHHPKNRAKGKKRKPSRGQKNGQGRYFGSGHIDIAESRSAVSEKHLARDDDDIFFQEGLFSGYISLDFSDEEGEETNDTRSEQKSLIDDDPLDVQVGNLDELIKPILILNRSSVTESSPVIDSPSERTTSYISEESYLL